VKATAPARNARGPCPSPSPQRPPAPVPACPGQRHRHRPAAPSGLEIVARPRPASGSGSQPQLIGRPRAVNRAPTSSPGRPASPPQPAWTPAAASAVLRTCAHPPVRQVPPRSPTPKAGRQADPPRCRLSPRPGPASTAGATRAPRAAWPQGMRKSPCPPGADAAQTPRQSQTPAAPPGGRKGNRQCHSRRSSPTATAPAAPRRPGFRDTPQPRKPRPPPEWETVPKREVLRSKSPQNRASEGPHHR